jgi:protein-tyrosine phosphatase
VDFDLITTRVATGAALSSEADVQALVDAGITHVVDARAEFHDAHLFVSHQSISYLWNPTEDDGQHKPPEYFAKTLSFALPALALPHTKVYCHCAAGVNRGPSNALAVMVAQGWTLGGAMALLRAARPQAQASYANDAAAAVRELGYA